MVVAEKSKMSSGTKGSFEVGNRVKVLYKQDVDGKVQEYLIKGEIVVMKKTVFSVIGYIEGTNKVSLFNFKKNEVKIGGTRITNSEISKAIDYAKNQLEGKTRQDGNYRSIAKEPSFIFKGTKAPDDHVSLGKMRVNYGLDDRKKLQSTINFLKRQYAEVDLATISKEKELMGLNLPKGYYETVPLPDKYEKLTNPPLLLGLSGDYSNLYGSEFYMHEGAQYCVIIDMSGKLNVKEHGRVVWFKNNAQKKYLMFNGRYLLAQKEMIRLAKKKPEAFAPLMESIKETNLDKLVINIIRALYHSSYANSSTRLLWSVIELSVVEDENYELMQAYESDSATSYATAFSTKKNINRETEEAMTNSIFLKLGFSYVEYDNEVDLKKVNDVAKEWVKIYKMLPNGRSLPTLRFRKLGKHNAAGVFFPSMNCVSVDFRSVSSFIHEYGHYLDYNLGKEKNLSLMDDFLPIIRVYRSNVYDKYKDSYVYRKAGYYCTPTEVFARGFELYISSKVSSSLIKDAMTYGKQEEYLCFDGCKEEMLAYMDKLFKL